MRFLLFKEPPDKFLRTRVIIIYTFNVKYIACLLGLTLLPPFSTSFVRIYFVGRISEFRLLSYTSDITEKPIRFLLCRKLETF